jgi:hypothetical protein
MAPSLLVNEYYFIAGTFKIKNNSEEWRKEIILLKYQYLKFRS